MNTIKSAITIIIELFLGAAAVQGADLQLLSPTELETMITEKTFESDLILIDVREDYEVEDGIIASDYCHPYHMSWNSNVLRENYTLLPTDMQIVAYCRSGSRSGQAGKFLIQEGFEQVASMSGGIYSYPGDLMDASAIKPLSDLPEPSYVGTVTIARRQTPLRMLTPGKMETVPNSYFTLNGKIVRRSTVRQPAPSVYLLEQTGTGTDGFHSMVITDNRFE